MGTLLHSAVVLEPIELSFGVVSVVSGVGGGMGVLDGVHVTQGEGAVLGFFGICACIGLKGQNDVFIAQKCIRLVLEKLTVFPYGQGIVGIYVSLAFRRYSQDIDVGVCAKFAKM